MEKIKYQFSILLIFFLFQNIWFARADNVNLSDSLNRKPRTSNVIGFIPSKANKVNGWAIGWLQLGALETDSPQAINGIYTNVSPLSVLTGAMAFPYILTFPFTVFKDSSDDIPYLDEKTVENKLNGIALSFFEASDRYIVNGTHISGILIMMYKLHGISMTLGATKFASFDGLMLSGLYNWAEKGRGIQIGLVNNSQHLKGIQIGLWNKIGRRGLPLLNFSFKRK